MAKIDLTVYPDRLENSIKRARERKHHHPDLRTDEGSQSDSGKV